MTTRHWIAALWLTVLLSLPTRAQSPQQPGAPAQPQTSPTQPTKPEEPTLPIGARLKKTVVFVTTTFQDGANLMEARGTGFFVFVPDKRLGENWVFCYLVTNRHVAAPENGAGHPAPVRRMTLNVNRRVAVNGTLAEQGDVPLDTFHWYFPDDDAVDLAVMPLVPDLQKYDLLPIPIDLFATKDVIQKEQVAEGDTVLFTGFFYQFPGQKRVEPIVRQGILAMMPDENLMTTRGRPAHIYLADIHVFGGNSGAPMFINVGGFRSNSIAGVNYKLLGIVTGYFYETADFQLQIATTLNGKANANSGIAIVVPVDDLKALLESPPLQKLRDDAVAAEAKTRK